MADIIVGVKRAALDAINSTYPVGVMYGTVTKTDPLEINVEQKLTLKLEQLTLTRNVTDYSVDMTVEHWTETEEQHTHAYRGQKRFLVHNALKEGEAVVLVRVQGGQKFIVLDRLGG